jgi:membrane protein implicated in regulation of membrane protease activity
MAHSTIWWILAGVAVAVEMFTLSFYLLMVALGLAAAAVAAHLGAGLVAQIVAAAVVGGGAVALWHYKRSQEPAGSPAEANRDVNMDIGAAIKVERWESDRTAKVQYRGSTWQVVLAEGVEPSAIGQYRVAQVRGSSLVLQPV